MNNQMSLLQNLWRALDGRDIEFEQVEFKGAGALASVFAVTDLAAASVGAAGLGAAELIEACGLPRPSVRVDRRLASLWFGTSIRPQGWRLPSPWDPIAGDYPTAEGWIRLHTNAQAHRAAALAVLGVEAEKQAVAQAVSAWQGDALEEAVVKRGGCAARMRTMAEWGAHPQGQAVAGEPVFRLESTGPSRGAEWPMIRARPLRGIRVLDMTRVLAGPVATRFLAGLGADVLRIDPPGWEEPGVVPEVTVGKRMARLDLRAEKDRGTFERLLADADVIVHGYRPGALAALGFDAPRRKEIRPGLVDVSLDAYGWSGPWAGRRGFDSLVQMSCGIADAGMREMKRDRPTPLPVQALDHATGYLLAAAVLRGLSDRLRTGQGTQARTSLARVAGVLASLQLDAAAEGLKAEDATDLSDTLEATTWGPARRLRPPIHLDGVSLHWDAPAGPLGSSEAAWR